MDNKKYISQAIAIAQDCLLDAKRYPFGSIVVKDDKVVGVGMEATRVKHDPTAHSEILAIRDACKKLGTSNLKDCVMYSSSEPCTMCLSAIMWAKIETVYFACSREDVYHFGFPDKFKLVKKRVDSQEIKMHYIKCEAGHKVFEDWRIRNNKKTSKDAQS